MKKERITRQDFYQALQENDLPVIADAVRYININSPVEGTEDGTCPLHLCVENNQAEVLSLLLQHGALVNLRNAHGYTALHLACMHGHIDIVERLVKSGATAIDFYSKRRFTPLMLATWYRHYGVASFLLANGAVPTLYSQDGWMAIHYAALVGSADLLQLLISRTHGKLKTKDGFLWRDIVLMQGEYMQLLQLADSGAELSFVASNKRLKIDRSTSDSMPSVQAIIDGRDANILHASYSDLHGEDIIDPISNDDGVSQEEVADQHYTSVAHDSVEEDSDASSTSSVISITRSGEAIVDRQLNNNTDEEIMTANKTADQAVVTGENIAATSEQLAIKEAQESVPDNSNDVGCYSFDQQELNNTIQAHSHDASDAPQKHNTQESQPNFYDSRDSDDLLFSDTDPFDNAKGLYRTIDGTYTNDVVVLTISNLLVALNIPYEVDRMMHGTVTPGEQVPTFSFFNRNGNVIVWDVLNYDPFEGDNINKWNKTKLWYQNNGFNYDINFFMSYFSGDAIDSKDLYRTSHLIKQQL